MATKTEWQCGGMRIANIKFDGLRFSSVVISLVLCLQAPHSWAELNRAPQSNTELSELMELPLSEMLSMEVTTASLQKQRLMDVPSAVFVISTEDILRSGAVSIPEILRMVPGVNVAKIDNSTWAISSRGFQGRYNGRLLVMIDGRSVFNQIYSGVDWDAQDLVLEDIDRIEVIRGSGAAIWGGHAMSGVINLITKSAAETQGQLLKVEVGSERTRGVSLRNGGALNSLFDYRVYAKGFTEEGSRDPNLDSETWDHRNSKRIGFRLDSNADFGRVLTVQGEVSNGTNHHPYVPHGVLGDGLPVTNQQDQDKVNGYHLLGRYSWEAERNSLYTLQAYYDYANRETGYFINNQSETTDLELHHQLQWNEKHQIIWGGGVRSIHSQADGGVSTIRDFSSAKSRLNTYSLFAQDKILLKPGSLSLIVGGKLEKHTYTDVEWLPNLRLLWQPSNQQTLWGGLSKAIRVPSVVWYDTVITVDNEPLFTTPFSRKGELKPEQAYTFELGYRWAPNDQLYTDLSLFYSKHSDLLVFVDSVLSPGEVENTNQGEGKAYGFELSVDYGVSSWWRVESGVSFVRMDLDETAAHTRIGYIREDITPEKQLTIRSQMDLDHDTTLDLWLRYVDDIPWAELSSYTTVDMRWSRQLQSGPEISLVGTNLFDPSTAQFKHTLPVLPVTEIERSFSLQLKWEL
ncbi:MAG: TonB-dependent receptor [Gammaproteobacteria bacterium]|jgi:iron complex outermembrane receptor protein|nr:TonB-dependent receptor [Gammaproteobacteria bacterium]MBT3717894.1 TonB-dependent receptor [Gammaproteobacteria bacterium]MBT3844814.1 TonB-dependent receptor [Gammaproteobacteria bacterium]MBT3892982.1 TonB-dependent receptor [Gammaproteobacteria bacterium]MBT4548174.1 TonB-dependent receptor [Gammaproteobacteria bacterium]